ncbi:MAG: hypothetical protein Q4C98_08595 [Capnocytophaga sp.]|nr:hypothetical protein [Capnocytophaga sp.]
MKKNSITYEVFQKYGAIFENISKNNLLKTELAEYGYDDAEIAKGKALYDSAWQKIDTNKTETTEEKFAYEAFSKKYEALKKAYQTDRKKAKIIFKDDNASLSALNLKGVASTRISGVINDADTLYKQLSVNENLRTPLKKLKIDETYIAQQLTLLTETQQAYHLYLKEKGESEQATKNKNNALAELEKWVKEFYAIAKIALEDQPLLLESLGKSVRN